MGLDDLLNNRDSIAWKLIRRMTCKPARGPHLSKLGREDIGQELAKELVKKYSRFDPSRASEATFIARVFKNKIVSLIRQCTAEKRNVRGNAPSLNATVRDGDGRSVELAQTMDGEAGSRHTGQARRQEQGLVQLKIDVTSVLKELPDDLRPLAKILHEMTEYAAARELGKSRRQIANEVTKLRERFEDASLREYLQRADNREHGLRI